MLAKQGIVSAEDAAAISGGLDQIAAEYEAGGLVENLDLEDIHMHVEARLAEIVGPAAGRLHTARSRNDRVATDRKSVVSGKSVPVRVDLGGRRIIKKKKKEKVTRIQSNTE